MAQQSVKAILAQYPRDELYTVFNATAFKQLEGTRFEVFFRAATEGKLAVIQHRWPWPLSPEHLSPRRDGTTDLLARHSPRARAASLMRGRGKSDHQHNNPGSPPRTAGKT
jgi:hypothetical protein